VPSPQLHLCGLWLGGILLCGGAGALQIQKREKMLAVGTALNTEELIKKLEKMLAVGTVLNAAQVNAEQLEVLFSVFYKTQNLSVTFCY
jgi:hypothetical protein